MEESQDLIRTIINIVVDPIITINDRGIIESASLAIEEVFGYRPEEVLGQNIKMLMPEPYSSQHDAYLNTYANTGEKKIIGIGREVEGQRKDGTTFPIELSVSEINLQGRTLFTGMIRDISERKQLEEQLRQSQKMQAVGQLTAGIAHNFNNRLMVISTAIDSLLLDGTFNFGRLKLIESSVEQAAKMIDQLLLFSHPEGVAEFKSIQIQEALSNVIEIGRKTFDRSIALIDEIPRNLSLISGDITQLEQVFLNLLLNARDAVQESNASSPSIHMVAKSVSFEEEDLPADLVSRQRNYLLIHIIDNGIGMNEETQQRVFEPFFTTKEVDKGTGLGLATAYIIVKDHQGWIECESQVGVGTIFSVCLPVAEQEVVSPVVEQAQTMPQGTETILLIEDEEDLRDQQASVFKQYGYEVLVGKDGQEGWKTFEREWERVDVVLLDLSIPNLSGQEVLAQMFTLNPDVKVILSTGYTQHSADALNAKALLQKPYRLSQALQTIRQVLDGAL